MDESSQKFKRQTLLIHSSHGNLKKVESLVKEGVDDSTGRLAIGRAALAGREEVVRFLAGCGKVELNNTYGNTPLDYVNVKLLPGEQKNKMICLLREHGAKTSKELKEEQQRKNG